MMKAFLYLFVFATVTLAAKPAKSNDVDYEANKKSLEACLKDCDPDRGNTARFCEDGCVARFPIKPVHGCHKKYCWSKCHAIGLQEEWCYTTKSHTQSYQYVQCTADSECNKDWCCGGPCAAF